LLWAILFLTFLSPGFTRKHPPALLILCHAAQAHLSAREAASLLLLAGIGADAVNVKGPCASKDLLAAGALCPRVFHWKTPFKMQGCPPSESWAGKEL
jgi:hypothetical protein